MNRIEGFDWDTANWPKCAKHGVSKSSIESMLSNSPAIYPDPYKDETRYRAIGKDDNGRYLFVVFAFRNLRSKKFLRPISARYMHQKEINHYEQRS